MAAKKTAKKTAKKRGRKPLQQVRAQKRRATTVAATNGLLAKIETKFGPNPFRLDKKKNIGPTNKALTRAIRHFEHDYLKAVEKFDKNIPDEKSCRLAVLSALVVELEEKLQ